MIVTDEKEIPSSDKKGLASPALGANEQPQPATSPRSPSAAFAQGASSSASPAASSSANPLDGPGFAERPPDYTPAAPTADVPNPIYGIPATAAPTINHGNYFSIKRDIGNIRGDYSIDPSMPVPAAMLPHVPEGQLRYNFDGQGNLGAIDVNLHVFSKSEFEGRAHIRLTTEIGNVMVRLNQSSVPLSLLALTNIGAVHVSIPRTFRGMIVQETNLGAIQMSPDVRAVSTSRMQIRGQRRLFIGEMQGPGWEDDGARWTGHELRLHSEIGGVRISFVDEPAADPRNGWAVWANSLFGK